MKLQSTEINWNNSLTEAKQVKRKRVTSTVRNSDYWKLLQPFDSRNAGSNVLYFPPVR